MAIGDWQRDAGSRVCQQRLDDSANGEWREHTGARDETTYAARRASEPLLRETAHNSGVSLGTQPDAMHTALQLSLHLSGSSPFWLHIIGDSTMRFLFAALLTIFNGTNRADKFPVHTLPDSERCSFLKYRGWPPPFDRCARQWRGSAYDASSRSYTVVGAVHDARGPHWRLSFEWWHADERNKPSQRQPLMLSSRSGFVVNRTGNMWAKREAQQRQRSNSSASVIGPAWPVAAPLYPTAVAIGFGLWETAADLELGRDAARVRSMLLDGLVRPLGSVLDAGSTIVVVGNGVCDAEPWAQRFTKRNATARDPTAERARRLIDSTAEAWVRSEQERQERRHERRQQHGASSSSAVDERRPTNWTNYLFLSRSRSMETIPPLSTSPCYVSHSHGILSEAHAWMLLDALSCAERNVP